ncbi:uncharacterized protein METZ01_LOCUS244433 [marine metagenome]|uniref:Uncharacterized protein n=1 Tax=marine metagenome TaxID=408172 RepID=A0A382HWM3_9ZZZZ
MQREQKVQQQVGSYCMNKMVKQDLMS